jgi:carboxylesterase
MLKKVETATLQSHPNPALSYAEAVNRIQALQQADETGGKHHPICVSKLMAHGERVEHAIVLLHGYTTCPEQFQQLGERYFNLGYNVLIPRIARHGCVDRLTDELELLTAEELVQASDEAVDLGGGLAEKVTVMGISGGGTMACWLAQTRPDLDFAIPIAAFLGVSFMPTALNPAFARLALSMRNRYQWWDPRTKEHNPYSIYYAYPRFSTRALGQILRLGLATQQLAEQSAPTAGKVLMVLNGAEPGVSNPALQRLLASWRHFRPQAVSSYTFEKALKMPHDLITPGTPGVDVELVYGRLVQLTQQMHTGSA